MKIDLIPGKFYESKDGRIWCCFHLDPCKAEHCQAQCVRCTDGKVEYFYRDGRYDAAGKREHTLVTLLPYWGADGDAREQFEKACVEARAQVREELRVTITKCKNVLNIANELVETLDNSIMEIQSK